MKYPFLAAALILSSAFSSHADVLSIKKDAPKQYVVKKGDTLYLKPFTNLRMPTKKTKLLIAQVESIFKQDTIQQLFYIGQNNFKRLKNDNAQWFKQ